MMKKSKIYHFLLFSVILLIGSCDNDNDPKEPAKDYNPNINDDYTSLASQSNLGFWGPYNLHDPSIIKEGNSYYIFSTDVAYGPNGKCGIMYRKSDDLVQWKFLGWVFNGSIPPVPFQFMQTNEPGYQALSIWAPYIVKVGTTFRLYYSVPSNDGRLLACIALATSTSLNGPWTDEGIVLTCLPTDTYNAIDPSVIIDQKNGKQWMSYGSYQEGIYIVELNPVTGKRLNENDPGHRIAYRTKRHDAIEGSEILYNPEQDKYYLFVSYDWLEDNYNVRVGKSDNPEGPYYDFYDRDMADIGDNLPIITARYGFKGHPGWQGFGHCGLLKDGENYFYVSQARLASNKYLMDLHIHRMVWNSDGWPSISPERFVNVPQNQIVRDSLIGSWEHIDLTYTTASNSSVLIDLRDDGTIGGVDNSSWSFEDDVLQLTLNNGVTIIKAKVFNEWDWENEKLTICYSGLSKSGRSGWGKKIK